MSDSTLKMILSAVDNASGPLRRVAGALKNVTSETGIVGSSFKKLKRTGEVLFAGMAIGATTLAGVGFQAVKTAANYETLKTALETSLGSQEASAQAFKDITKFASRTPFQVEDVTGAFIKLKNLGLDPSERALTSYGDTASAMGKSLNDMVEAVADAATGEFERLKEFGIRASSEGDRVKFTFKGVTTEVGKNSAEIEEYLLRLGETNFAGGMEKQSKTLAGRFSTLRDTISLTLAAFAEDTGLVEWAGKGIDLTSKLMKGIKPLYDLLVKGDYSAGLNEAFGWAEDSEIVDNILSVRDTVRDLANLILKGDYSAGLNEAFGWAEDSTVVTNILNVRDKVIEFSDKTIEKFEELNKNGPLVEAALIGIATAITVSLIPVMGALAAKVAIATWPFLAIAAAAGALFYLFQTNESVRNFLTNVWDKLVLGFTWFKDNVLPQLITLWETKLQPAFSFLGNLIMTMLWPALQELWQSLTDLWLLIDGDVLEVLKVLAIVLGVLIYASVMITIFILTALAKVIKWLVDRWVEEYVRFKNRWDLARDAINIFQAKARYYLALVIHKISVFQAWVQRKVDEAKRKWDELKEKFEALKNINLWQVGSDIVQGLINGITSKAGQLAGKVSEMANSVKTGFQNALGIQSPSRWAMWAMQMVGDGLTKQAQKISPEISRSSEGLADSVMEPVENRTQPRQTITNNNNNSKPTVNITFAPQTDSDPTELFALFERWLAEKNLLTDVTGV